MKKMIASPSNIANSINIFFNETAVTHQEKLVTRQKKVNGPVFLKTLVCSFMQNDHPSLSEMVQLANSFGLSISEQGFSKRFNENAFKFLEAVFLEVSQHMFDSKEKVDLKLLNKFSSVSACDTSTVCLPDVFHKMFRGLGDKLSKKKSSIKLDTSIELLKGNLKINITEGITPDNKTQSALELGKTDSLQLRDLAYFDLSRFAKQSENKVYFISRYKSGVNLFNEDNSVIDLLKLFKDLKSKNLNYYEFTALAGNKEKVSLRVILSKIENKKVAKKRRKKSKRKARKNKSKQTPLSKALSNWSILVTNVPKETLSGKECYEVYRMRWQIELVFKLWKEFCKVDESNSQNPWRVLCEIYAKLIGILVQHWIVQNSQWQRKNKSFKKGYNAVRIRTNELFLALESGELKNLVKVIEKFTLYFSNGCNQNSRKKHPNAYQIMNNCKRRAS